MNDLREVITRQGIRLLQHGTILSEIVRQPGPTDTTADVLAALVSALPTKSPLALLGFAGGSLVAPLRALHCQHEIQAVDLDDRGYDLFRKVCRSFAQGVVFQQAEASAWLQSRPGRYNVVVEDLSVPENDDVTIPEIVWTTLPELIRCRLQPAGFAIYNLLRPPTQSWSRLLRQVSAPFACAAQVLFRDFENRIVVAARNLPPTVQLSRKVRAALARLGSTLSDRITLRTLKA